MKKIYINLVTTLSLILTFNANSESFKVKLDPTPYQSNLIIENTIKYDENGYDQNGYNIYGFNSSGIHNITQTAYDLDGYDFRNRTKKVCKYNINTDSYYYTVGVRNPKYTLNYKGKTIFYQSRSQYLPSSGKLFGDVWLSPGSTGRGCRGQYSGCWKIVCAQKIRPIE